MPTFGSQVLTTSRRSMDSTRVVVTGVGAISPVGESTDSMMQALYAGTSGITRIERWDPEGLATQIAAECSEFDPTQYMDRKDAKRADRYSQLAIAASREAVAQAKLTASACCSDRASAASKRSKRSTRSC